ncbi:hypothetical protein F3Y22_tig00116962pilonHSYRG00498 [Hibiscus syriacus]|uniref:cinnamyl-alcohol dehydrogenase n=1 Tax=Hibiscus syriacus TaxID=106335 RepID=A0A6A2WJ47_HIBSY|nr:hypothetical protein F3Y22_tig00116962pilonHSYRG00498 [Hibiscus syriacus]
MWDCFQFTTLQLSPSSPTVKIWGVEKTYTVQQLLTLPPFNSSVNALSWVGLDRQRNHGLLAVGMETGLLEIWSLHVERGDDSISTPSVNAAPIIQLDPFMCHVSAVNRLAPVGITVWAVTFGTIKRTISRIIILMVSMGHGVMRPTLGGLTSNVIMVGVTFFLASEALELVENAGAVSDLSGKARLFLVLPVAILDAFFILWIFTSLSETLNKLQKDDGKTGNIQEVHKCTGSSRYRISGLDVLRGKKKLTGNFIGSIAETQEILEFWAEKGLSSMLEVVKMDYINTAFQRLEKNDVRYRFVLDVAGSNLE